MLDTFTRAWVCIWVCYISSGLYPLPAHSNSVWQDPVGQLALTLYLVMPTRATLYTAFPDCGWLKPTIWLQERSNFVQLCLRAGDDQHCIPRSFKWIPPIILNEILLKKNYCVQEIRSNKFLLISLGKFGLFSMMHLWEIVKLQRKGDSSVRWEIYGNLLICIKTNQTNNKDYKGTTWKLYSSHNNNIKSSCLNGK